MTWFEQTWSWMAKQPVDLVVHEDEHTIVMRWSRGYLAIVGERCAHFEDAKEGGREASLEAARAWVRAHV